eukprot:11612658-Alexandrium_andersonii.AAC.1
MCIRDRVAAARASTVRTLAGTRRPIELRPALLATLAAVLEGLRELTATIAPLARQRQRRPLQ